MVKIDNDREDDALEDGIARIMADFGDDYWLERDSEGGFPEDFYQAMAEGGWLGIGFPEELGGSGLGIRECAVVMRRIACSPGAMAAASAIHMNVFGPRAIVEFGTEAQRRDWIPPILRGETKMAFAVTEPDAGLDTGAITTRAEPDGAGGYRITGQKIWTSTAQVADKVLLLVRTAPRKEGSLGEGARRTDGLSLFYLDLDRRYCDIREIEKMGRKAVDSNEIFFDGLPATPEELVGEEGQGFSQLLQSLNPERILVAAEAVGIGQEALRRAAGYAAERVVFDRPIGQNQAIQHPLAESWAELEAAWLLCLQAAELCDRDLPCGAQANAAKYLAAEAGYRACERAVLTFGGMGYAKAFHVERLLREIMIPRLAPVSQQMALNYIAERVLDLPKSY
jgi:acyl-CoA dehydrogenase